MELGILASIIVGGLAGWGASKIMKARTGILINILLGILGAVLANWLLGLLGIMASSWWVSQLIVALIGACILIWAWRAIKR